MSVKISPPVVLGPGIAAFLVGIYLWLGVAALVIIGIPATVSYFAWLDNLPLSGRVQRCLLFLSARRRRPGGAPGGGVLRGFLELLQSDVRNAAAMDGGVLSGLLPLPLRVFLDPRRDRPAPQEPLCKLGRVVLRSRAQPLELRGPPDIPLHLRRVCARPVHGSPAWVDSRSTAGRTGPALPRQLTSRLFGPRCFRGLVTPPRESG